MNQIEISVVVPVYNSELIIDELCKRLLDVLSDNFSSFEILLIDDASTDNVALKLNKWEKNKNILCLYNQKNMGQLATTKKGIVNAKGFYIATIDDDLEYNPEDIINLYKAIKRENVDVVFGIAKDKYQKQGKSKFIAGLRNKILNFIWNKPTTDSFKIIDRRFLQEDFNSSKYPFFEAYLLKKKRTVKIHYLKVLFNKRYSGSSNYNLIKRIIFFLNINRSLRNTK